MKKIMYSFVINLRPRDQKSPDVEVSKSFVRRWEQEAYIRQTIDLLAQCNVPTDLISIILSYFVVIVFLGRSQCPHFLLSSVSSRARPITLLPKAEIYSKRQFGFQLVIPSTTWPLLLEQLRKCGYRGMWIEDAPCYLRRNRFLEVHLFPHFQPAGAPPIDVKRLLRILTTFVEGFRSPETETFWILCRAVAKQLHEDARIPDNLAFRWWLGWDDKAGCSGHAIDTFQSITPAFTTTCTDH